VVGSEDVANLGKLVEEVVLETEHGSGTDDGGLGVDVAGDVLTPGLYSSVSCTRVSCSDLPQITDLGSEELGGRVPAGIVGGNVNEAVDIVLGDSIRNALNTVHMDILVGEVPDIVSSYSAIYTNSLTWWGIGGRQGCRQCRSDERSPRWTGCCAGRIPTTVRYFLQARIQASSYQEHNTAKITSDLQVSLRHLLTVRNDNGASLASCGPSVTIQLRYCSLNLPSLLTM
jgi:hypothetical protein